MFGIKTQIRRPLAALTLLAALLGGCADLSAIRKWADASAESTQYTALVDDYVQAPARNARYAPTELARELRSQTERREAQKKQILAVHEAVSAYMRAVGQLASDEVIDYSGEFDGLASALKQLDIFKASAAEIEAANALGKLLAKAVTDAYRQRKLKEIISNADEPLGELLGGVLVRLLNAFDDQQDQEKTAITKYFDNVVAAAPGSDAAKLLQRQMRLDHLEVITQRRAAIDRYRKVLAKIQSGHQELAARRVSLSDEDVLRRMRQYAVDLHQAFQKVRDARG